MWRIWASFSSAWSSDFAACSAAHFIAGISAIAGLEYKERSLQVRFKPGGTPPTEQMKTALANRNLALEMGAAQAGATVWQIRSAR